MAKHKYTMEDWRAVRKGLDAGGTIRGVAAEAVGRERQHLGKTSQDLSAEDRLAVIAALERDGIFLLKGVIREVAGALGCSQASVYRYLAQIRNENAS